MSLATALALARILGPDDYGIYTYAGSILVFVLAVSDFGLSPYIAREGASSRSALDRILPALVALRLTVLLAGLGLFSALYLSAPASSTILALLLLFCSMSAESVTNLGFAYLQSMEVMRFEAGSLAALAFARATGAVVVAAVTGSLSWVLAWFVTATTLQLLSTAYRLRRTALLLPHRGVNWSSLRALPLRSTALLMAAGLSTSILLRADAVVIGVYLGTREVGIYMAGYTIATGLQVAPLMLSVAYYPLLARGLRDANGLFQRSVRRGIEFAVVGCLPVAAVGFVLAEPLVSGVYGGAFTDAAASLSVLIWWLPVNAVALPLSAAARAAGREGFLALVMGGAAVTSIALNLALIPQFGLVAAAATTVAMECGLVCILYRALRPLLAGTVRLRRLIGSVSATAASAMLVYLTARVAPPTIAALSGGLAYLVLVLALGIVTRRQLHALAKAATS